MLLKCYGDFSWLPNNALAGIELPTMVFTPVEDVDLECSGFYNPTERLIVVCEGDEYQDTTAAIIAHEFRHHMQNMCGETDPFPPRFNPCVPYGQAIAEFYSNSKSEYEALLFEHKFARNWCNDWQLRKLVNEQQKAPFVVPRETQHMPISPQTGKTY